MLWSGLVSQVGVSHRVSLIAPFLLGQNCPRKTAMSISVTGCTYSVAAVSFPCITQLKPETSYLNLKETVHLALSTMIFSDVSVKLYLLLF